MVETGFLASGSAGNASFAALFLFPDLGGGGGSDGLDCVVDLRVEELVEDGVG